MLAAIATPKPAATELGRTHLGYALSSISAADKAVRTDDYRGAAAPADQAISAIMKGWDALRDTGAVDTAMGEQLIYSAQSVLNGTVSSERAAGAKAYADILDAYDGSGTRAGQYRLRDAAITAYGNAATSVNTVLGAIG